MSIEFKVSDNQSPTWLKLKEHLEERLTSLRIKNEGNLTEIETANLRGRCAELRALLMLGQDEPPVAR